MSEADHYIHGVDQDMPKVIEGTLEFIETGDDSCISLPLIGLEVYAVIAALRAMDESHLYETLDDEQIKRVEFVEAQVDLSVFELLQYFPFGHKRNERALPHTLRGRLSGFETSWGVGSRKRGSRTGGHAGEFVNGALDPRIATRAQKKKQQ